MYIYMIYIYEIYIYIIYSCLKTISVFYVLIYPSAFKQFWDSTGDLTRPILG